MATVDSNRPYYEVVRDASNWFGFSKRDREQMLADDLEAGRRISLLLTAIVVTGLVIGLVGTMLAVSLR